MKLGVFDSGLGGLIITKAIREALPDIDIFYYGDTLHLPYGDRSCDAIFEYTKAAMNFMFAQDCQLIIIACNTATAAALDRLQQAWLADAWPGRNIIGVIEPTLETIIDRGYKRLGLIGTSYTIQSGIYEKELQKLNPEISLQAIATPKLALLIENNAEEGVKKEVLQNYLDGFKDIDCLILGCTHYGSLKPIIAEIMGDEFPVISQDDLIPEKLKSYLERHPEHYEPIGKNGNTEFWVSDLTQNYIRAAQKLYGSDIYVQKT